MSAPSSISRRRTFWPCGPGLVGDELHAEDLRRRARRPRRASLRELDAAALAAAAGVDLRLDDPDRAAELLRRLDRLVDAEGRDSRAAPGCRSWRKISLPWYSWIFMAVSLARIQRVAARPERRGRADTSAGSRRARSRRRNAAHGSDRAGTACCALRPSPRVSITSPAKACIDRRRQHLRELGDVGAAVHAAEALAHRLAKAAAAGSARRGARRRRRARRTRRGYGIAYRLRRRPRRCSKRSSTTRRSSMSWIGSPAGARAAGQLDRRRRAVDTDVASVHERARGRGDRQGHGRRVASKSLKEAGRQPTLPRSKATGAAKSATGANVARSLRRPPPKGARLDDQRSGIAAIGPRRLAQHPLDDVGRKAACGEKARLSGVLGGGVGGGVKSATRTARARAGSELGERLREPRRRA